MKRKEIVDIENIKFFLGDLKASNYNLSFIQDVENLIQRYKKLEKQMGKDLDVVYIQGVYDERDRWRNKIKELAKKYEYAAIGYDSSEATFKQSQDIGRYVAYCNLLNKEEE